MNKKEKRILKRLYKHFCMLQIEVLRLSLLESCGLLFLGDDFDFLISALKDSVSSMDEAFSKFKSMYES